MKSATSALGYMYDTIVLIRPSFAYKILFLNEDQTDYFG